MKNRKTAYLDYNATTPVDHRVMRSMLPYFSDFFGNASSDHLFGWEAKEAVEQARAQLAKIINVKATGISFTSGATEAANLAIFGYCEYKRDFGNHIITCKTEHKAILDCMKALEERGFEVTYLGVDREGNIDLQELENSITPNTILVSLMLANNETGLIHPIGQISKIVHSKGVRLMSDLTQAVGKITIDLEKLGVDMAIFSSHKIYGPKGIGALYLNPETRSEVKPYLFGGGQENGKRPGTLNVPGIVGFGKAASILQSEMIEEIQKLQKLRNELEQRLIELEGVEINSGNAPRLPNTINIRIRNVDGDEMIKRLNKLAVSRGSACTSNTMQPSHVLKAMGLSDEEALSSIRISLGRPTTQEETDFAFEQIQSAIDKLKKQMV
ncbi:cysteine desulfurase [Gramella sp. BOM4]|nr:cysteine desulfurase [Christiangramia bathymodioli]